MFSVLKIMSGKKVRDFCSLLVAGKWKHANRILFFSCVDKECLLESLIYDVV